MIEIYLRGDETDRIRHNSVPDRSEVMPVKIKIEDKYNRLV